MLQKWWRSYGRSRDPVHPRTDGLKKPEAGWCSGPWFDEPRQETSEEIDGEYMKAIIWEIQKDLRPNMPLKLCRVKTYSREGISKDSFSTELQLLGKHLKIAPIQNRNGAEFILKGWVKILDGLLAKYELTPPETTVNKIDSPETLMQSVVQSEKYKQIIKE